MVVNSTKTEDCPSNVFATWNPYISKYVQNNIGFNHGNTTWFPNGASNTHSWCRSYIRMEKENIIWKLNQKKQVVQSSQSGMVPTELNFTSPQSVSNTTYGWQVQFSGSDQNFYTTNGGSTVATITSSVRFKSYNYDGY